MIMETTTITTKVCSRCKRELPLSEFHKNVRNKLGVQSECKECRCQIDKEYKQRFKAKKEEMLNNIKKIENIKNGNLHPVYAHQDLARFSHRQLMEELKARGFKWDYMLEPQRKIYFDKI